ncbi:MAG TPA: NUDIX domain-containing protein [Candidatus Saccharimonadales bacterium]|jgi:8-oxo-dGTP pyrophosphatase MutT (NUDIX family)|nr:NUDIX domain-containing protein [Candidatus Saccharimonadales bacterium]
MLEGVIRPLALCIVKNQDKVLVGEGFDSKKNETFYRFLGGGIEFGEKGEEAIKREFLEELGAFLENVKYLTTLENIFTYDGKPGHEIVLVFTGDLTNKDLYQKVSFDILDSKEKGKAFWKEIKEFKEKKLILYPEEVLRYL